jgi:hypothetical protein
MSNALDSILQGLGSSDSIKDYQHASKIFVDGNFLRSPKFAHSFYVTFDFAEGSYALRTPAQQALQFGALCKTAQLPKFTVDAKVMNAYNRPNLVQTKLKYDSVNLTFHDDSADIIRDFWFDYMTFYYRDSEYQPAMYGMSHKYKARSTDAWGYQLRPEWTLTDYHPIKAINIYSMSRGRFSQYQLINPMITSFAHGQHKMEGSDLLEHSMTVQYEAVKYYKGYVNGDPGLQSSLRLIYDNVPGPLSSGVTRSIFGQGGLVDATNATVNDLASGNFVSAFLRLNKLQQTFKGQNLQDAFSSEVNQVLGGAIRNNTNTQASVSVPTLADLVGSINTQVGINNTGGVTVAQPNNFAGTKIVGQNYTLSVTGNQPVDTTRSLATDNTATSDSTSIVNNTTGTNSTSGFPTLPNTNTPTDTNGVKTLQDTSANDIVLELARRGLITLNDAQILISGASQGTAQNNTP